MPIKPSPYSTRPSFTRVARRPLVVGECVMDPITEAKPYYYLVVQGDYPAKIAKVWNGNISLMHRTMELLRVNHDKPGGLVKSGGSCDFKHLNAGDIIKIPASWSAAPQAFANRLVNADGTKYTPVLAIPPAASDWDQKHPQWDGSNIAYWSQRIEAVVRYIASKHTFDGEAPGGTVQSCVQALSSSAGRQSLYAFLRRYPSVQSFVSAYTPTGPVSAVPPQVPGLWFANPSDALVAFTAVINFVYKGYCDGVPAGTTPGTTPGTVGGPMKHTVTGNETPRDVTQKYTGSTTRVSELVEANPEWPKVVAAGMVGNPVTFDPYFWRSGVQVNLPESWTEGGSVGRPHQGSVGANGTGVRDCTADIIPLHEKKPYFFLVKTGDWPDKIAKAWLGGDTTGTGPLTTRSLLRVNYDKAGGFVTDTSGKNCNFAYFNNGDIIKIPAAWPAPPTSLADRLVNADGSKYVPGGDVPVEPDVPGDDGIDRINWTDGGGAGGWVWPLLIIGGAALGGVLLVGASKKGSNR